MGSLAFVPRFPTFGAMKLRQMWGTPATGMVGHGKKL
jgi:hypothetical protein